MGLAPTGWSVQFFKQGDLNVTPGWPGLIEAYRKRLPRSDAGQNADEQQTLTVNIPLPEDAVPPERFSDQLMGPVGQVIPVTVHDRPAHLVMMDAGYLDQRI